ncbi:LysR substrate-binding domain-containing protein [Labrys wisconsinensis]|uniref:DNA-binding transcriptional LysR family regulator n=1 Tax=Labrys wisconsinensis TaxID=425677 RepID=A0ABU0JBA1_9HYPH|nr:LysR substrate-binding domain-containing protein [Labrys wisconsinensis]MDQ0471543.1 DNA-binding transcriptional LysR family regulator [Labrys wisconsinensis]
MRILDILNPVLLQSFVAVSETRSFTAAARRLGLQQSAVSQHIARLEQRVGRRLFARDTHSVTLTPDGDAVLPFVRQALEAGLRIERYLEGSDLRGRIRFGASEDFVSTALPEILADFTARHSAVDLELTVGLSGNLYEAYDAGELDLVFAKRREGDRRGETAWEEAIGWIGRPGFEVAAAEPLPLLLYPPPSITRAVAIEALERAGRRWRIACTSASLSGLRAAALAGLGVTPHSVRLIPPGLAEVSGDLPALGRIQFVVLGADAHGKAVKALAATLLANADRITAGRGLPRRPRPADDL